MAFNVYRPFFVSALLCASLHAAAQKALFIQTGIEGDSMSRNWKSAIRPRMSAARFDSMTSLRRTLSAEELKWQSLISAKAAKWNSFRDSLRVPFANTYIHDTVFVLLGYLGNDDGFTWQYRTVCIDLTALYRAYGDADQPVNNERIDRVFSHEYTHLLHKEWARQHRLQLTSFRDSILWECIYEGIGMYRSLSAKWLPVNGVLPPLTMQTMQKLTPVFVDRLTTIQSAASLTNEEKERLNAGLSRGPVDQKWGALPVAIWLLLEAGGDEKKLNAWIQRGPEGVIALARKYLTGKDKEKFESSFFQLD
jgi:hypothetical protein